MPIYRLRKTENFAVLANSVFEDPNLSWEARGVHGYLLTKPDNWIVRVHDLAMNGPAGTHKIGRILRELERSGRLKRARITRPDGTFEWEICVYEDPSLNPDWK